MYLDFFKWKYKHNIHKQQTGLTECIKNICNFTELNDFLFIIGLVWN